MKIALVQKKAVPNDVKANLDLAVRYMEEAGRRNADLVRRKCGRLDMRRLFRRHLMIPFRERKAAWILRRLERTVPISGHSGDGKAALRRRSDHRYV